jgi:hypothetical protein
LTPAPLLGSVTAVVVFVLVLAPPGYWLLSRFCGLRPRAQDLGLALGAGYAAVLPLVWLERALGAPVLALAAAMSAVIALRADWRHWLDGKPGLALFVLPALLGAVAYGVNAGDARWDGGGGSFAAGFDLADRAFYALVSQEVRRAPPPAMQNPLFAGVPFAYSFLPALASLLLQALAGLDALATNLHHLPVVAFVFLGLAADALLREWNVTSLPARVVTPLLLVLGGDLSFVFPASGVRGTERTAHFIAFASFSAESLYYNPWMLALPVVLVALVAAGRWLRGGGRGWLWLAAWMLASLWQTKVFACVPLLAGAGLTALLRRDRRMAALALASGALVVPWVAVTLASGGGTARPLVPALLRPVRVALEVHPAWHPLGALAFEGSGPSRGIALVAATLLVLVGGLGVRLLGVAILPRRVRQDGSGLWAWLAVSCVLSLALGLSLVGDPVPLDGVQFLILAQLLLWLPTGPLLGGWIASGGARRWVAVLLLPVACASPAGYVLRKTMPDRFTAPRSVDRLRIALSADHVAAASWLARQPLERANLAIDYRPVAADPGARRPFYVAALANRRLCAFGDTLSVPPAVADERRLMLAEAFDTADPDRALALLDGLGADWVWVEDARPLRYAAPRLKLRTRSGAVSVYERVPR